MANVELQQIGPYTITRLLSEGATSMFYLARHQQRKQDAIIKVLLTPLTSVEAKEAFVARAKQLKKLKHRHIIEVQDYGFLPNTSGSPDCGHLVMQYVAGESIRQRIPVGKRLAPDEVKRILSPIADALHYAHINNIVHGNLHPGNLLIGERDETLLTDFSLLLLSILPAFNGESSSIPYRAPEHLRGTSTAPTPGQPQGSTPLSPATLAPTILRQTLPTAASDQYALAVMVYQWLCGQRPYEATTPETLLYLQEHEPLPEPRSLNDTISPAVENVLLQALSYSPEARFPHTLAFSQAYLYALMGLPVNISTRSARPPAIRPITTPAIGDDAVKEETAGDAEAEIATIQHTTPSRVVSIDAVRKMKKERVEAGAIQHPTAARASDEPTNGKKIEPNIIPINRVSRTTTPVVEGKSGGMDKEDEEKEISKGALSPIALPRLHNLVTADLCRGGILSRRLPGYEERPAQIEMATLVADSLIEGTPAVIEAATGTGKSLAYLIPIVRSNRVAIISTANKALQEQLFYKDIPFVQKHIKPFDAALVKGMGNYVCLDRLTNERLGIQFYAKNQDFTHLIQITDDEDSPFNGDFETLGFPLPGDIRSRVNADSDQCAWGKCDFYSRCYVRKMRVKAEHARVIVVNHTLLLLDAFLDGHLLPERDIVIIDEAHHLEEEATRCFTVTVSPLQVSSLLAQSMLKKHSNPDLQMETNQVMMRAWDRLEKVADPGYKGRANLQASLEEGLLLASVIAKLADSLRQQRPLTMPEKEEQLYDKLIARTENLAANIRMVFSVDQVGKYVYYVERINSVGRRGGQLQVSAAPLDVTDLLKEQLFRKCNVVCTSATLATVGPNPAKPGDTGPNFVYFRRRVGLDPATYPNTQERILPLIFDYEGNSLLYLPRDLPEPVYGSGPASDAYTKAIAQKMLELVKASRGRAFLLFSSKRMLDAVYEQIANKLDFPLLRQGEMPRIELTRRFREEEGAVLFGLKSFWEGVDIAGEALSLVVIDKLPFDPPDDPVHEARVAQMKAAGENWFGAYVLPQTALRLKQGLGRLLRTREDRGVMAILDTRLYTKGYGKTILTALPPARRTASLKEVEQFFAEESAPF